MPSNVPESSRRTHRWLASRSRLRMFRDIRGTRTLQRTSHMGRRLRRRFWRDSWPFCPTSGVMRNNTLDAIFSSRTSFGNMNFLRCFLGCLEEAELSTVAAEIRDVSHLSFNHGSWAVKTSKNMSRILRHDDRTVLGKYMEFSLEGFQRTSVKPFDWHPRKFFSFLMANSKGRFKHLGCSCGTDL